MKSFDAFELGCSMRVAGITDCDTLRFFINRCKVYNGICDSICIENVDGIGAVTEIQTDVTNHNTIIDWLLTVKEWLEHNSNIGDKYVINMIVDNDVNSVTYDPRRKDSSFYRLELCVVHYGQQRDYAEYDLIDEVPIIKIPQKGGNLKFYTKNPGIKIYM